MRTIILLFLTTIFTSSLFSQNPFGCVAEAYLFQYNDVYGINLASGHSFPVATDITSGNINAAAYNPADGFIWGYISTPANSVVRVGNDFKTDTYTIPGYRSAYVGAIDSDGVFYSKAGSTSYDVVDLNPSSASYLTILRQGILSQNISIADWAFNSADAYLYTAGIRDNILYRIDPNTSEVIAIGEIPALSGFTYTYGAVYFDVDGNFYISANQTGAIYQVKSVQDLQPGDNISSSIFSYGPASAANDGARCPTAAVPQEICGNGIDDDGDSLIDCDDPSCSEYVDCLPPTISGGNEGGLESNSRLGQAIANRNYKRTKSPADYPAIFGEQLERNVAGENSSTKKKMTLQDLVPRGILGESHAFESSPSDLIEITNADEVFSVDYFKEENSLASVLALKTTNGVYEHSKFICDRLLGAELNSVSTIFLKEQPIIRSIIYRPDGSREFVLSFSARLTADGIVVESHWNLDKYTKDETYYNFQIWTSSIDDLITLSEGILDLLDSKFPIAEYQASPAPYTFVRRATYKSGVLSLLVMNNDFSSELYIDGGMRSTETSSENNYTKTISLKPYSNYLEIETGEFFDLGFRISTDREGTPDDLFISDGPWGYDDSAVSTTVLDYEVTKNPETKNEGYDIERTVEIEASTSEYVSLYRAITPRFEAVDMSSYNSFTFDASGTGNMEIMLVKESVTEWSQQLHASVLLSEEKQGYTLTTTDFRTMDGETLTWDDIKLITFTVRSSTGEIEQKKIVVGNLNFGNSVSTSTKDYQNISSGIEVYPNPVKSTSAVIIQAEQPTNGFVQLIDGTGKSILTEQIILEAGANKYMLTNNNYPSGYYHFIVELESGERRITKIVMTN